jgi:hypothetical protein
MASLTPPERLQEPSTSVSRVVKSNVHALLVAADVRR